MDPFPWPFPVAPLHVQALHGFARVDEGKTFAPLVQEALSHALDSAHLEARGPWMSQENTGQKMSPYRDAEDEVLSRTRLCHEPPV